MQNNYLFSLNTAQLVSRVSMTSNVYQPNLTNLNFKKLYSASPTSSGILLCGCVRISGVGCMRANLEGPNTDILYSPTEEERLCPKQRNYPLPNWRYLGRSGEGEQLKWPEAEVIKGVKVREVREKDVQQDLEGEENECANREERELPEIHRRLKWDSQTCPSVTYQRPSQSHHWAASLNERCDWPESKEVLEEEVPGLAPAPHQGLRNCTLTYLQHREGGSAATKKTIMSDLGVGEGSYTSPSSFSKGRWSFSQVHCGVMPEWCLAHLALERQQFVDDDWLLCLFLKNLVTFPSQWKTLQGVSQ